ncbi:MAG: glycerol-3-phosphate acyltransferase [Candidatus Paceibacterota bacterium]
MQTYILYLLLLIVSYLAGSIPFSYIITRLSTHKNILEIGWKKSSGSNVLKNVGKWQGVLVFLLDVAKGFFVIWLARELGTPAYFQSLCGVAAVVGHNWSIFLKGSGGRGLAALVGALLAFSPLFLAIILLPTILLTFLWTASIGTLLSLAFGIAIGFGCVYCKPMGLMLLISLTPIFIKRLSPIKEIPGAKNKAELIKNRLLFDQDTVPPLRITKYFNKKKA